jgi:CO/xanthine dehydrogenase Mo-binding subunit
MSHPVGDGKAPAGTYHGLAQFMGYGSYVAACAEVSVSTDGRLKIHRIVAATNPGHAVNPAQIERQVAGSFVYGLSAAPYGEITVNGGAIEQTNFRRVRLLAPRASPARRVAPAATAERSDASPSASGGPSACPLGNAPAGRQRASRRAPPRSARRPRTILVYRSRRRNT